MRKFLVITSLFVGTTFTASTALAQVVHYRENARLDPRTVAAILGGKSAAPAALPLPVAPKVKLRGIRLMDSQAPETAAPESVALSASGSTGNQPAATDDVITTPVAEPAPIAAEPASTPVATPAPAVTPAPAERPIVAAAPASMHVSAPVPAATPVPAAPAPAPAVASAPAPAPAPTGFSLPIQFALNSSTLMPRSTEYLDVVAEGLKMVGPEVKIYIEGHTDALGNSRYNLDLSWKRAMAVRTYLAKRHGISESRLIAIGMGQTMPIEGLNAVAPENRRVEFRRVV